MYKAIGEAAYNDGLFSQAAPLQDYQASVSQFGDGGLGAVSYLIPNQTLRGRYQHAPQSRGARRPACPPPRDPGAQAAWRAGYCPPTYRAVSGPGATYADGSLGRTFLPAFSKRAMQGLGYAYHDGSLGDAVTVQLPGVTSTPAASSWKPDLASLGVGVIAGGLLFYFTSKH